MILVDTSVWIDFFRGRNSGPTDVLFQFLGKAEFAVGDLILFEILQGAREEHVKALEHHLEPFRVVQLSSNRLVRKAAANYRYLRRRGLTIRGPIDMLIGTWCIEHDVPLLHKDRDFDAMEAELGLRVHRGD